MKKTVIIVDGYSTGRFFAKAFLKYGLVCWHIESLEKKPSSWDGQFVAENYIGHSQWQNNFSLIQQSLPEDTQVVAVLAGSEPGVELADFLANQFHVMGNPPTTSLRRRNKAVMAQALRQTGVRTIEDCVVENTAQAANWLQRHHRYPVVVKPIDSAGTEGFHLCHDFTQTMNATQMLLGHVNAFGKTNEQILLQEYIHGTEYIVNTVSLNGEHFLIDAWQSNKQEIHGSRIYDREILLSPLDSVVKDKLLPYLRQALSALDVQYGPCHSELFIDDIGVVLIESGARPHGATSPAAMRYATGWSHLDAVTELVADLQQFRLTAEQREFMPLSKFVFCVEHIAHRHGRISGQAMELIRQLPSYFMSQWVVTENQEVNITRDLFSCLGNTYLIHHNLDCLERDYQRLRQIERDYLIIS
ncbi:MAG TPA: ATP-grasp domain-containing protein [Gammaproteobacteria bacterium]|nr:ATP-grasp domain-containing protein [Gammaproteobacteria bacterium]